jgi:hypothetical protein
MRNKRKNPDKWFSGRSACNWPQSSTRWLMENYDIWSATPSRGADLPPRPLSFK